MKFISKKSSLTVAAVTLAMLASSAMARTSTAETMDSLTSIIEGANELQDSNTENFLIEVRQYNADLGASLVTGNSVKKALAECAFTDNGFSTLEKSYRSAAAVWKTLRADIGTGRLKVYRSDLTANTSFSVEREISESCNVSGAPCGVILVPTQGADAELALFVQGDTCQ